MLARIISFAAFATLASTQLMPSAAEAARLCFPFLVCRDRPHDDRNYESEYEGEEPEYTAPKKKPAKAAPAPKPSGAVERKASSTRTKAVRAAPALSCDKAGEIVSGYGFTNVTPATCTGQVFAFNATRSGKTYVIKLSATNGELKEVKKVQ